jgi:uncharacterized SAM-binding protein YcdF (DUF218 family)
MLKTLRLLGMTTVVGFLISAYSPLWNFAGGKLAIRTGTNARAESIVVLASGVLGDGSLSEDSLKRLIHGLRLFKHGAGSRLVLSGPKSTNLVGRSEADVRRRIAIELGLQATDIKVIENVATTYDEARETALLLANVQNKTVLLVTDSLHMRRALAAFARQGLRPLPSVSDDRTVSAQTPIARLALMKYVMLQSGALLYYRIARYA